ncbi:hypothetical protein AAIH46_17985 [Rhizobium sp. 0TCS1.26]|uniref:hypothetical protein n=1 Tax=Rhizobium sp. 0TCS1.26 TaxID=3142623 RepID=UPI003D281355
MAILRIVNVAWADRVLHNYGKRIVLLHQKFPLVLPRIVNQVGDRAKTQVVRGLTVQTGLPRKTIVAAVGDPMKASFGRLSYEIKTRGGNIRLKYLNPKETEAGVVAKPFGKATLYPGAFIRGGWWPDRVDVEKFGGHVMVRVGRTPGVKGGSRHYTFARSGVFIPVEMTRGATLGAFNKISGPLLRQRVDAALAKLVP